MVARQVEDEKRSLVVLNSKCNSVTRKPYDNDDPALRGLPAIAVHANTLSCILHTHKARLYLS